LRQHVRGGASASSRVPTMAKKRLGDEGTQASVPTSASVAHRAALIWSFTNSFSHTCTSIIDQCLGLFSSNVSPMSIAGVGSSVSTVGAPSAMSALRYVVDPTDVMQDLQSILKGLFEATRAISSSVFMRIKRHTTE
jgi:hypothetical protein